LPSDRVTIDVDPDSPNGFAPEKKWVGASKHLMTNKTLGSIKTIDKDLVEFLASRSFSGVGERSFVIPRVLMADIQERLGTWKTQRDASVAELGTGSWDASIQDAKEKLGFLFNSDDYPSASLLPQIFAVTWRFEEVSETLRQLMRTAAVNAVQETIKRVEPSETGRDRRFTEKTFAELQSFLDFYDARQAVPDEELDALRVDIQRFVNLGESYLNMREGGKASDRVLELARKAAVSSFAPVVENASKITSGVRAIELED
jgi:hypothetical protein